LAFLALEIGRLKCQLIYDIVKERLALQFTTILFAQNGKKEKEILSLNARGEKVEL
jgi:hypothetical protein